MRKSSERQVINCLIGAGPDYYLCWYEDEPENLQSYIPDARAGKPVSIGNYVQHYRSYFDSVDAESYMIDVGANMGLSAFPVASINHRVVCFEPVPVNLELLAKGIERNQFESLVQVVPKALSDRSGVSTIFVPENRADNASSDEICSNLNVKKAAVHQFDIETLCFDQWWSEHKDAYPLEHARLFKIDTQGHEYSILQGARTFLHDAGKYKKLNLELEWDSGFLERRGINGLYILKLINQLGYEIISPMRLYPSQFEKFAKAFCRCDLICRPRR